MALSETGESSLVLSNSSALVFARRQSACFVTRWLLVLHSPQYLVHVIFPIPHFCMHTTRAVNFEAYAPAGRIDACVLRSDAHVAVNPFQEFRKKKVILANGTQWAS